MRQSYKDWFRAVNAWVEAIAGCVVMDLADCPFYDWWEDGVSPKVAAKRALEASGW